MSDEVTVSLTGARVMVGIPAGRDLPAPTVRSLLATQSSILGAGLEFGAGLVIGCAVVQKARDEVIELFLESDCTHLFWIDSDMVWEPEDFMRVLAVSETLGIGCGAYPSKIDDVTTFFVKCEDWTANDIGCIPVDGIGLGFFCMQRHIVEELVESGATIWDDVVNAPRPSIFRIDITEPGYKGTNGRFRSEDIAFCSDIQDLGYKIYLDQECNLGHVGTKVYRGSIKDALKVAD